jgi:uncharacterized protein involved in exopolysaccharide biosynthesis
MRSKLILGFTLLLAGLVLCGIGLWLLLSPAQYAATTRIKVENEAALSAGDMSGDMSYDPYFIQTEFEVIQSQLVLSNVVFSLNLNKIWGEKYANGSPLKTSECIAIIHKHLHLDPVRNTKLIAVTFYSADPSEAADMANTIVRSYCDYQIQNRKKMMEKGLEVLTEYYETEEAKIREAQTNLNLLRQKLGVQSQNDTSDNHSPEQQPYWDEKQKLEQLLEQHKLLKEKIEIEKLDASIPKQTIIQVVDRAEPPKFPIGPDRVLGVALCFVGLFPLMGGILLLKSSRCQIV